MPDGVCGEAHHGRVVLQCHCMRCNDTALDCMCCNACVAIPLHVLRHMCCNACVAMPLLKLLGSSRGGGGGLHLNVDAKRVNCAGVRGEGGAGANPLFVEYDASVVAGVRGDGRRAACVLNGLRG